MKISYETSDLLVFSHLRWDLVFQRPQHLLSRYAKFRRVYYFEEPVFGMTDLPKLHIRTTSEGVQVVVPYLPLNLKQEDMEGAMRDLVNEVIFDENIQNVTLWYYTPMALPFTRHIEARGIIFDCMDEFSVYKDPSESFINLDSELIRKADLVFTAGHSLYEEKKHTHHNIHAFPSSIDYGHFSQGRLQLIEPDDQVNIPHPRIGFYGVIDESFNVELLDQMAELRSDYQFIIIGPNAKIEPDIIPKRENIHYLGRKDYHTLPLYLSGWDCTMLPFEMNDATRFIGPTNTPEFLAAGKPVVSTPIKDVVYPYAQEGLIHIAYSANEFILCITKAIEEKMTDTSWLERVDSFLSNTSWDKTFEQMAKLESDIFNRRQSNKHFVQTISISSNEVI